MTQPTKQQIEEAMEWVNLEIKDHDRWLDCSYEGDGRAVAANEHRRERRFLVLFRTALEQYKPKTVSREDAMNLFSFLCDVYKANGNTGTEFILWLKERGIEVEGQSLTRRGRKITMAIKIPDKLLLGLSKVSMSPSEWRVLMYAIDRYYKGSIRAVRLTGIEATRGTGISSPNLSAVVSRLIRRNIVYVAAQQGTLKMYALQTDTSKWVGSDSRKSDMCREDEKSFRLWWRRWGYSAKGSDALSKFRYGVLLEKGYTPDDINAATTAFFTQKIRLAVRKGVLPEEVMKYHPATFLKLKFKVFLEKTKEEKNENPSA